MSLRFSYINVKERGLILLLDKFIAYKEEPTLKQKPTIEILDGLVASIDYLALFDPEDEQDLARLENIKELRSVANEFPKLSEFLDNVALVEKESRARTRTDSKGAVSLMTLHAAKGLEFNTVFLVGMEEGLFPHSRTLLDRSEMEEERRLCYVGITRARENLFLTYARKRLFFGARTTGVVSRFVSDIPESLFQLKISSSFVND